MSVVANNAGGTEADADTIGECGERALTEVMSILDDPGWDRVAPACTWSSVTPGASTSSMLTPARVSVSTRVSRCDVQASATCDLRDGPRVAPSRRRPADVDDQFGVHLTDTRREPTDGRCRGCGAHVTDRFIRVLGTEAGVALACPD